LPGAHSPFSIPDFAYLVSMTQQSQSRSHTQNWLITVRKLVVAGALIGVATFAAEPAAPSPSPAVSSVSDDSQRGTILLTIFLRHHQAKPLDEINAQLRKQGYYKTFPPAGVEVVSWYVMMGVGQVITLRLPPDRLRDVNLAIEKTAWGGYRTEFYPTYDYKAIGEAEHAKAQ
jgi:hypothetical protein